jgi:hypothetical protein
MMGRPGNKEASDVTMTMRAWVVAFAPPQLSWNRLIDGRKALVTANTAKKFT